MKDAITNNPGLTVACIIVTVIMGFAVLLFAPVKMMLDAIRDDHREAEQEFEGTYPINAQWPSESLSREFEQEPRGM